MNIFLSQFIDWAHRNINQFDEPIEYLHGRGVVDWQIDLHKIGYVSESYSCDESIDKSQDCQRFNYKMKSGSKIGSIILPITSYSGKYYGFQSKSIDKKDYDIFIVDKRPEAFLFGVGENIDHIWSKKEVIITEGPFDALTVERFIGRNVVSIMTNAVSGNNARFFTRFADDVVFCLDNDTAGRDGFDRSSSNIKRIRDDIRIRRIKYSGAKDMNDLWLKHGNKLMKYVEV